MREDPIIDRRTFLAGTGAVLVTAPRAAEAQQAPRVWRIGLFHVGLDHVPPSLDPLRRELKVLGYAEGKNLRFDWRNLPDEEAARITAKEFVRQRVDLIVAFENQTVRAAKAATSKIPIVFLSVSDPVADGFVNSRAYPGGNLTGLAGIGNVPAKEIEIFKEVVPALQRLLVLSDPRDPSSPRQLVEVRKAGTKLRLNLLERVVTSEADIERLFSSIKKEDADGVVMASPNLRVKFQVLILRLASERRLPLAGNGRESVEKGALFSYADDSRAIGRAAASRYVDRILKGAKPADLPVEDVEQYELVINLKTAKALGLTIPPSVLGRADEVIQ